MMVLLSKKEYDDLVKKATAVELLVEERVEAEKTRIWSAIREGLKGRSDEHAFKQHPVEYVRALLEKVIG